MPISEHERRPPGRGNSDNESRTALNWVERQLIPRNLEARTKDAVNRITGGVLSDDEVARIYDGIVKNITMSEAMTFGGINPYAQTINLTNEQCRIIDAQIGLLDPKLREKASTAFEQAKANGKIHCR